MSYEGQSPVPAQTDQRAPRKSQLIRATLLDSAHAAHAVVIRNVSASGVGGTSPGVGLKAGESVTIQFRDDVWVQGTVAWANGERFGIKLREGLDLEFLTDMIRRKQATTVEKTTWEVRRLHKVATPQLEDGRLRRV